MAACTTLVASASSFAGGSNCCVANGGVGCDDAACQAAVCAIDPFCCSTAWDGICASEAAGLCAVCGAQPCDNTCPPCLGDCNGDGVIDAIDLGTLLGAWGNVSGICNIPGPIDAVSLGILLGAWGPCPAASENEPCGDDTNGGCNATSGGTSNCCVANGGIGCDDAACQDLVCAQDSFCCSVAWDGICAGEAATLCPALCPPAVPAYGSIACGQTLCGSFWADGSTRDTDWLKFTLTAATTEVTLDVSANFGIVLGFLDDQCPPFIYILEGQFCPASVTACLAAGTYTAFIAPNGFSGLPCGGDNGWVATLTCVEGCELPACGASSAGDCCTAHATPFCNDAECCDLVCGADPFCCSVQWDGLCAGSAANICCLCGAGGCDTSCPSGANGEGEPCGDDTNGGCNVPPGGTSNCCVANGGIGCDDAACQDLVCAQDPFCCSAAWDGICAGEAATLCPALCPPGVPSYGTITPGTPTCGNFWADGSVRDTDWYSFTVGGAASVSVTLNVASNFPTVLGFLDDLCPPTIIVLQAQDACPATVTACLAPGNYTVFVAANAFSGLPCGTEACGADLNAYVATVTIGGECSAAACGNSDNDCFAASPTGTPFCSDADCCNTVCAIDPFCCSVSWDGICAGEAASFCGGGGVSNDECNVATTIGSGATAFSTVGATTSLPALDASCEKGFGLAFVNDIWFSFTATSGNTTVSLCRSGFDTRLAVYAACGDAAVLACNDDFCGLQSQTSFASTNGTTYKIRVGGFGGSGNGTITITP